MRGHRNPQPVPLVDRSQSGWRDEVDRHIRALTRLYQTAETDVEIEIRTRRRPAAPTLAMVGSSGDGDLTTTDAAAILHCSDDTVRRYVDDGRLTAWRHGRRIHLSRGQVERLAAELRVQP